MFHAVEIDGEAYWDGGYSGNPTLTPLVRDCDSDDTILIQVNPVERATDLYAARDIASRLNEISFNAVLLQEIRMMALLRQVADPGHGEGEKWAKMRIHRIASADMLQFGHSSKLNAEWAFLWKLKKIGRKAADDFLKDHGQAIGRESTLDIDALLAHV
jgi:NTE family protein